MRGKTLRNLRRTPGWDRGGVMVGEQPSHHGTPQGTPGFGADPLEQCGADEAPFMSAGKALLPPTAQPPGPLPHAGAVDEGLCSS